MINSTDIVNALEQEGFAIVHRVVDASTIMDLIQAVERLPATEALRLREKRPFGIRNLLEVVPLARRLGNSDALMSLARMALGKNAKLVRGLFFDKPPQANWKVVWHQDLTIAVGGKVDMEAFGPWTTKAGVPHVQPPASVLEGMIALRVHLDDSDASNGALKVISGSHKYGRISLEGIADLVGKATPTVCAVPSGGILLMRPLLLHSSSAGSNPFHRRVIHFEFSASQLPQGLEWYEQ